MPRKPIDKRQLLDTIRTDLRVDLDSVIRSQKSTQEGATHVEAKPEDDKDTRALEGTYLARGLAQRVVELRSMIAELDSFEIRDFGPDDRVTISALVTLEDEEEQRTHYFLVSTGGGKRMDVHGERVRIITPESPVGQAMIGKQLDDDVRIRTPKGVMECVIVDLK